MIFSLVKAERLEFWNDFELMIIIFVFFIQSIVNGIHGERIQNAQRIVEVDQKPKVERNLWMRILLDHALEAQHTPKTATCKNALVGFHFFYKMYQFFELKLSFHKFYTCSLIFITDECCNSLFVSSVVFLYPGSYVYHQTASDGRKIFIGPQNTYVFSFTLSSGNKVWAVSSFYIRKMSSNHCVIYCLYCYSLR